MVETLAKDRVKINDVLKKECSFTVNAA